MKSVHSFIAAALLASFGLAATAQPAAAPAGNPSASAARDGQRGFDPARFQERMARRLDGLKQKLQLSPGQENAWNAYVQALTPTKLQRPDREEFAKLTTPERIDRMRQLRAQRSAEMDKRADATKAFYAVLNPEQKKTFDDSTLRGGRWGGGGHHGFRHHG